MKLLTFLSTPYTVSITSGKVYYTERGTTQSTRPYCGGALISSSWVITSAACALITEKPVIGIGEHNWQKSSETSSTQL